MLVSGNRTIEMQLNAAQLLQLGIDCLQVAVALSPEQLPAAAEALSSVSVPAHLHAAAVVAISESHVTPGASCRLN